MNNPAFKQPSARSALIHMLAREIVREMRAERAQVAGNQSAGQNQPPIAPQKP